VIGQSYGGGKVAYILQPSDTGYDANVQQGLIAAASDQSTGIIWALPAFQGASVGTGTAIGTGLANTNAIATQNGTTLSTYAAGLCYNLGTGGYSDWYLPSKDELAQLYAHKDSIGGFESDFYWSSSELAGYPGEAWGQYFVNGNQNAGVKSLTHRVRAVRAFVAPAVAIGQSYGGGNVAYILQPGDPGYVAGQTHGLIAAASDQSTGIRWYNGSYTVTGATGLELGTGSANTTTIITSQGATTTSYAAGVARAYAGGGFNDWYLPSLDELYKLFLSKAAIGGFVTSSNPYYWSSSEFDADVAWFRGFVAGDQATNSKADAYRVRAVRAF